jgi:hypothetical protein
LRKAKASGGVHWCSGQVNTISAPDHTEAQKMLTATIDAHNHGSEACGALRFKPRRAIPTALFEAHPTAEDH